MHIKWSDYITTVVIRAISGSFIGMVVSVPAIFFGGRLRFHHGGRKSLLVEWIDQGNYRALAFWFGAWAIAGAVTAVATIPTWQRPWYKGVLDSDEDQRRNEEKT